MDARLGLSPRIFKRKNILESLLVAEANLTKRTVIHQGKFREKRPFHHLTVPRFSSLEKRTRTGNEFGSCACMISSTATKCQTARAIEFF